MKSKYFKLQEFLNSDTARNNRIDNLPSWETIEHLQELAAVLDTLREVTGAINITSGYRSSALNKKVGGVKNSAHLTGYAADLTPVYGSFDSFVEKIRKWAVGKQFDQIIVETSGRSRWVHFSLKGDNGQQRCRVFEMAV